MTLVGSEVAPVSLVCDWMGCRGELVLGGASGGIDPVEAFWLMAELCGWVSEDLGQGYYRDYCHEHRNASSGSRAAEPPKGTLDPRWH